MKATHRFARLVTIRFCIAVLLCVSGSSPAWAASAQDSDGDGLSDDWERGFGRYSIVPGVFTWDQARRDAAYRGGHLATVINAAEWADMKAVLGTGLLGKNLWIGGTDEQSEGNWRWLTGEVWRFSNWRAGEPSNDSLGTGHGAPENHLMIWVRETALLDGNNLYWNDVPITGGVLARDGYVLERGAWSDPLEADTDLDGLSDGVENPIGTTYQVIPGQFTWAEAALDAFSRRGHLAVFTSLAEWQIAQNQAAGGRAFRTSLWLGATDQLVEGRWEWVTGEPFLSSLWSPGQPDNQFDQDFLQINPANGLWQDVNDTAFAARSGYLIERAFLSLSDANNADSDSDGLLDGEEVKVFRTDPSNSDTDEDGLSDADEVRRWGSDPRKGDTDADGLDDRQEVLITKTNPLVQDTDRDTFPDGEEVASGTDPLNPASNIRKASREYTAIEIEFGTVVGERYQMQAYTANRTWENIGSVVQGTGQKSKAMFSTRSVPMKLWRVVLVP